MAKKKPRRYWIIRGWDGTSLLYEHEINVGQISVRKLKGLLKVLASKISLSESEIISSYANRGTNAYSNFLEVQYQEGRKFMYSCGTNPYVTAELETENAL